MRVALAACRRLDVNLARSAVTICAGPVWIRVMEMCHVACCNVKSRIH